MSSPSPLSKQLPKDFWAHTERASNGCLHWLGASTTSGNGRLLVGGKTWLAHRYAWFITYGPIPDGLFVCHHCDNPICVEPTHLFLGTDLDNQRDAHRKGRHAGFLQRGQRHSQAKLTEAQVAEIKRRSVRVNPGIYEGDSPTLLAAEFHVGRDTIYAVLRGTNWSHIRRLEKLQDS